MEIFQSAVIGNREHVQCQQILMLHLRIPMAEPLPRHCKRGSGMNCWKSIKCSQGARCGDRCCRSFSFSVVYSFCPRLPDALHSWHQNGKKVRLRKAEKKFNKAIPDISLIAAVIQQQSAQAIRERKQHLNNKQSVPHYGSHYRQGRH